MLKRHVLLSPDGGDTIAAPDLQPKVIVLFAALMRDGI